MNRLPSTILVLSVLAGCYGAPTTSYIVLSTTTSVANSDFLDVLLPRFREQTGVEVHAHLVGSGLAIRMLDTGDADMIITHAPEAEASALRNDPTWRYRKIMFDEFVLVGPQDDPAHVKGVASAVDAMRRIAASRSTFLSRSDSSGTHERQEQLWRLAGTRPSADRLVVALTRINTLRISSLAYATEDRASEDGTASPVTREKRS